MISVIHTGPYGVNTLIVPLSGPYVFVVDPACCSQCGDERAVTSFLKNNSYIPLAFILTHGHYDHVAGLPVMKEAYPDVPVLIHEKDRERIGKSGFDFQSADIAAAGLSSLAEVYKNLPESDGNLTDGSNLYDCLKESGVTAGNAEAEEALKKWSVLWTPGHTMGSVCLYNEESEEFISGDTVFYGAWGRTDLAGGSDSLMADSLKKIYRTVKDSALVYPGHDYCGFELKEFFTFLSRF
ncbi:MBL fold metallo-hydrolase [Treponema sp.]|uniref:MBL fold metallo-hydrolase n=1 Tax=Treponema sp. TaxID=166 RepID=UPI00257C1901|nr:MBL fold metallo-hydrolase [Treponema sp.]MBE6353706.1 MBL fold metallo-hydrolase [Treponema sp.]